MLRGAAAIFAACALTACVHSAADTIAAAPGADVAAVSRPQNPALMERLVGDWVLTGTIGGENVVHDVDARWVLQGNYVRLNEVSRERDQSGKAAYEAIIYVGWLDSAQHFVCIWLDNTAVAAPGVTCVAAASQDALEFEFRDAQGSLMIATTFAYHPQSDSWDWRIDNIENGRASRFADLTLRRR